MNPKVDAYFAEGCGRCELYQTPQCKVHSYVEPMEHLRQPALADPIFEVVPQAFFISPIEHFRSAAPGPIGGVYAR